MALPAVTQVALPAVIQVALPAVIQVALPAEILLSNHTVQAYDIYRKVSTGPATGSSFQMHDNKKLREQNVSAVFIIPDIQKDV